MNLVRSIFLVVAFIISSGLVATAQDFNKGYAAYQAGDLATKLQSLIKNLITSHGETAFS